MADVSSHKGYTSDSTDIELLSRFLTMRSVKILPSRFESDGLHSQPVPTRVKLRSLAFAWKLGNMRVRLQIKLPPGLRVSYSERDRDGVSTYGCGIL